MSDFHVEVVRLANVAKHPNADTLSIADANGQPVIFRTGDYAEGDLAVYIPVDAIVPDTEEFAFLKGHRRIKAAKLRGVFSMGLLAKVRDGMAEGDDVQAIMGVEKYDRDAHLSSPRRSGGSIANGDSEPAPPFAFPEYTDIEGYRRHKHVLRGRANLVPANADGTPATDAQIEAEIIGEEVVLTEKIHGANARFVYRDGRLWVGSRHQVKARPGAKRTSYKVTHEVAGERRVAPDGYHAEKSLADVHKAQINAEIEASPGNPRSIVMVETVEHEVKPSTWWQVATDLGLEDKLKQIDSCAIYGEVYGQVQDLKYGKTGVELVLFDALDTTTGRYLDHDDFVEVARFIGLPTAPVLYRGPWSEDLLALAEGPSTIPGADCIREGFVVRPVKERRDDGRGGIGRVILKVVGENYLLRKGS